MNFTLKYSYCSVYSHNNRWPKASWTKRTKYWWFLSQMLQHWMFYWLIQQTFNLKCIAKDIPFNRNILTKSLSKEKLCQNISGSYVRQFHLFSLFQRMCQTTHMFSLFPVLTPWSLRLSDWVYFNVLCIMQRINIWNLTNNAQKVFAFRRFKLISISNWLIQQITCFYKRGVSKQTRCHI